MEKINDLVNTLGIRATYCEYHYLCYALELCRKNENYIFTRILRNILKKAAPVWNMLFVPS